MQKINSKSEPNCDQVLLSTGYSIIPPIFLSKVSKFLAKLRMFFIVTLYLGCIMRNGAQAADLVRIGGLFETDNMNQQIAFRSAVEAINSNMRLLSQTRLLAHIEMVPPNDSFRASKKVCSMLEDGAGVAAIFGPQSDETALHVRSICDAMEIPHIENRWDNRQPRLDFSLNLYPHISSISKAYHDVLKTLGWKRIFVIYDSDDGLVRIQDVLKSDYFDISLRQLPQGDIYRPMLKDAKKSGVTRIVIDVEVNKIYTVLKQAQQIGMMTSYYDYFITSLDLHTVDLEDFRHAGTNISALRLFDPERGLFIMRGLKDLYSNGFSNESNLTLTTEIALMYDAVHMFATALDDLDRSISISFPPMDCDGEKTWIHGNSLLNYMKIVRIEGLTGLIQFDAEGFRSNVSLDIIELWKNGIKKVGRWDLTNGASYSKTAENVTKNIVESLQNKTLLIATALNTPYTMLRNFRQSEILTGNDRYEGFCIDLIEAISNILGFKYTLKLADDGMYGRFDDTSKQWTGMIRELIDQKVDAAIGDITITYEREQAVDFTMPWMNLGIGILYQKPKKYTEPCSLFSFLNPLTFDVWLYVVAAFLTTSVLLFLLARFSPYEWTDKTDSRNSQSVSGEESGTENKPEVREERTDFTLLNSLWFCIGSIMQQRVELQPRAVSTRIVVGIWWFFVLIMICTYTANLTAFLLVGGMDSPMKSPIESAEDLAAQTKIKYGTYEHGTTRTFFRTSKIPTYQRMYNFMESQRPSVYANKNENGVQRVRNGMGNYAYFMESPSIEYITERNCDLTQIGGLLDSKSYGIALPTGSPYTDTFSKAILDLQEKGVIARLKTKWWKERRGGGACHKGQSSSKSFPKVSELGLNNVGGIFVVLLVGMGLASVAALVEFLWKKSRKST